MKKFWTLALTLLIGGSLLFTLLQPKTYTFQTTDYFSTAVILQVKTRSQKEAQKLWEGCLQILQEVSETADLRKEDSEISRFNALSHGEEMVISETFASLWQQAEACYELTGGAYDPTVYPLVKLWGFAPAAAGEEREYTIPEEETVKAYRQLLGCEEIVLGSDGSSYTLYKGIPDREIEGKRCSAMIDLGGIAKGYVCDRVRDHLQAAGVKEASFRCGSSSLFVLGESELTLSKPRPGANEDVSFGTLRIKDQAAADSSDAYRYFEQDGIRYCHILDPETGYPINVRSDGLLSAVVLSSSAAEADALSTAFCIRGAAALQEAWAKDYVLVDRELHVSSDLADLSVTDGAYQQQ